MLYKKKVEKELTKELFQNPTAEFRATPFWAWNCELKPELLKKEIEYMKEMGFGGFHMHSRVGLGTPYLSDEFMGVVKDCVEKAKEEDMLAYLYDEDKWPSGFAGGYNTKDPENRLKSLTFTMIPYKDDSLVLEEDIAIAKEQYENAIYSLLGVFDVEINDKGDLVSYKIISAAEKAEHRKWFAYLECKKPTSWYNGYTYCDTLSKKAIEGFVETTHERYKECFGDEFNKTIPSIFTDEPQYDKYETMADGLTSKGCVLPYTGDFDETFKEVYGYSVFEKLPEVVWNNADGSPSLTRYHYIDHLSERFAAAFCDTLGDWCKKNDIHMTGHLMAEPDLESQTMFVGECMRAYRGFTLPGIDILINKVQFTTAKQCQSAAHQYGCEGVLSELYGVTTWNFDFKGHKLQGDWQAALGITLRVPHLYWVSMRGEAKRDYPAAIGYQSPWYKEYKYIEDHFARVNTALTRGTPDVKIGVIHPIESFWMNYGPVKQSTLARTEYESKFHEFISWMLYGTLDFDYICESQLPTTFKGVDGGFGVGEMKYDVVVVPSLYTIRSTTLDALEKFTQNGGKVIFIGGIPSLVDGIASDRAKAFADTCKKINWANGELMDALEENRDIEIRAYRGAYSDNLIYQLRHDGDKKHLFISHVRPPRNNDVERPDRFTIKIKGEWKVTELDTLSGDIRRVKATYKNGNTIFIWDSCTYSSLLVQLEPGKDDEGVELLTTRYQSMDYLSESATFTLSEPNVLLLDRPAFKINDGETHPPKYILYADNDIRAHFGMPGRDGGMLQPWLSPIDKNPKEKVLLTYHFDSDIEYEGACLALESVDYATVKFNGQPVSTDVIGYYIDEDSIKKIALPKIVKGDNVLEVEYRYGYITQLEAMYLLGDFGVENHGTYSKIVPLAEKLWFGSITNQTLPFYGGNVTYHFEYEGAGEKTLQIPKFRGSLVSVDIDGKRHGVIAFTPHCLDLGDLGEGKHTIDITVFGNRSNTLSIHHNLDVDEYNGPASWRRNDHRFVNEYLLRDQGLMSTPRIFSK